MKAALLQRTRQTIFWMAILPLVVALVAERTSSEHAALEEATLSTDDFLQKLDDLLSTIKDAELGERGFLLTGTYEYLEPFIGSELTLDKRFSAVQSLGYKNNIEPQEIQRLHRLLHKRMSELEKTIEVKKQRKGLEAGTEFDTDEGRQDMTEIRSIIERLKNEQMRAFRRRLGEQRQSQQILRLVLTVAIGLGFALLIWAYRLSVLYARERDEVEVEIRQLNATLERRVLERTAELQTRTRELELRSAELQRSNADLTQFAYVASHDLQEPLRMVGSYMGLLARKYCAQLDEAADTYIQFAIDGAGRMQTLIIDLLNYSRAGTQKLERKPVPIEKVLQGALKNLEMAIKESCAVVTHGQMPVVHADESKLTQVLQNLIGNAIKFRKPNIQPMVEFRLRGWEITGYSRWRIMESASIRNTGIASLMPSSVFTESAGILATALDWLFADAS